MFPLKGVIPPAATPLLDDDCLDVAAYELLLERCIEAGVHGIFTLGTTGEGPALSQRLRRIVLEQTVRIVRGRVPVLVGVTDSSLHDALSLARAAADLGVQGVVTAGPCYFPASQPELVSYVRRFAAEAGAPVFVYNMPSHTKVAFSVETLQTLAENPRIAGVKDSSAQMLFFQQLLTIRQQRPDFTVLMGPEELLAESVLLGGCGGVCGGANLHPQLYVDLYESAVTGDLRRMLQLQQQVQRLSMRLYAVGDPPSAYLCGLKAALSVLGIGNGRPAPPLTPLEGDRRRRIEQHVRDLGLLELTAPVQR